MTTTIKYILPLISFLGVYTIFIFSSRNGLFTLLDDAIYSRTMPAGDGPIKTNLTGIKALDEGLLIHLNAFFLRVVDGSAPDLSLYAFSFTGSFGAAWILITVEAWRKGNAGTLMASYVFRPVLTYYIIALHVLNQNQTRNVRKRTTS